MFAREHWGRRPLLSRAKDLPRGYDDLLSLDAVDELLSRRGLRTPFVRLAKDGSIVDANRFTRGGGVGAEIGDQVADDAVAGLFADGSTVVLQGLHRTWPPLVDFATALAAELGHPVQVNAYVTPPQSRGFSAHYDVHDVFVLQLAGEKRWLVHEPVLEAPLRRQVWTDRRTAVAEAARGQPLLDVVLRPGDALYLPRGYLHAAEALGAVSAHLTVGIHPVTRYALVEALLADAADDAVLRASLPLGLDLTDDEAVADELAATVDALTARLHAAGTDEVTRRLRPRVWSGSRPAPLAPLRQARAAMTADAETMIALRPALRCAVVPAGNSVTLELGHRRLTLPATAHDALTLLAAGRPARAADLPGLDNDAAVELVRRLLREGVVVPVDQ